MMMNSQAASSGLAYYCYSSDPGEATASLGDDSGCAEGFLDIFGDRQSSGDLFDLVWQGGAGGSSGNMEVQPATHLPSSSPAAAVVTMPPSEDEMAAWLYPIVRGDDIGLAGHATMLNHKRETEEKCRAEDSTRTKERRKKETGGTRKSHNAETHNLTEKRRRCKINEKFKTLQQLVPGCDKSNQASTLDQTIQYMKSLQQQIQAMSFGCGGMKSGAVYPVVPPPYLPPAAAAAAAAPGLLVRGHLRPAVVLAPPSAMMVPFRPPLQYPVSMASAPMLYPAAPNNM